MKKLDRNQKEVKVGCLINVYDPVAKQLVFSDTVIQEDGELKLKTQGLTLDFIDDFEIIN